MIKRIPILIFLIALFYLYFNDISFDENRIKIGSSLPKSGTVKAFGNSVSIGANAYFKYVNDTKLLRDKRLEFIVYDDKYEPNLTKENITKLIYKDNVYALFGLVGTPTVKNILPIIEDENVPLIAPFTGASFLRDQNNKNFINFRSSYKQEIETTIEYLNGKKGLTKFAVFYQNDDYGVEGYVALLESLNKRDLSLSAEGSYKRNTLSISHAFHEIKDAKPEAIIMVGAYKANTLFIKKAKKDPNFKDTVFCNISFGDANSMIKELKQLNIDTRNLLFSQVVPNYLDEEKEVIKEYRELMKRYYPDEKLGFVSLEAFLASKVLVSAISRIKGSLTREKLLVSIKNTPPKLLKGLSLNFKNRQLLNNTSLFIYEKEKFKEIKR